ncbi:DUF6233 domain-containing protein [Streptomyces sp. GESEQ-35]|uniref:DUF6233 domain-containing protein n=1 Tax=Streptomyces sp. GESEQ-35 TaxID=2812657 RepID=UPI0027E2BC9F|nr:DUF6233 domain-containing protein [Streptomyces sp. GESEQ-35]
MAASIRLEPAECGLGTRRRLLGGRPASRAEALDALRQQVPAFTFCRPHTALGFLD